MSAEQRKNIIEELTKHVTSNKPNIDLIASKIYLLKKNSPNP